MTKPTNDQDNNIDIEEDIDGTLHALYQKRKSQHGLPNSVRQNVVNTLSTKEHANASWWKVNLKPYMQISAVACSVALAFIVISLQVVDKQPLPMKLESAGMRLQSAQLDEFQKVELHELAPQADLFAARDSITSEAAETKMKRASTRVERKVQYQRAENGYLARQTDIAVHHQSFATIVKSEDGLSLLTCDQNLLKLSQDVVDLLMSGQENSAINFSEGQMVALTFDNNGHIINIKKQIKKTEC